MRQPCREATQRDKIRGRTEQGRCCVKVLVVEDHPMMADALREALLSVGRTAEVVCLGALAAALDATAGEAGFDLALLDLGLPDCARPDGLARLREERPYLPVVVVSGASDPETIVAAL